MSAVQPPEVLTEVSSSASETADTTLAGLASEIVPRLFQGRRPKMAADLRAYMGVKITASISLVPNGEVDNADIDFLPGALKILWPIEDDAWIPEEPTIRTLAVMTSRLLDAGHRVLVCCHAGLNRSGLIVARTLIYQGMSPEEAINLIRERRSQLALSNPAFVDWLLQELPAV